MRVVLIVLLSLGSCAMPKPQAQNPTVVQTMAVRTLPGSISELQGSAVLYSDGRLEAEGFSPQNSAFAVCMFKVDYKVSTGLVNSIGPQIGSSFSSTVKGAMEIMAFLAKCEDKPFVFKG